MASSRIIGGALESDIVLTPDWAAKDIMEYFKPHGTILDPSRGNGAFHQFMPNGSPWCEVREGRDFFEWDERVDWIVGNPPYSIFRKWITHSFAIADNIVYLLPIQLVYNPILLLREIFEYGGIPHFRWYDVGLDIPWSRSRIIVAAHFKKSYLGGTTWSVVNAPQNIAETCNTSPNSASMPASKQASTHCANVV